MKQLLILAAVLVCSSFAQALPSAEDIINKVAPILWSKDKTQAILFSLKYPDCSAKIISYTVAQDYALVTFINGLKVTKIKSIPGMSNFSNAPSCKKLNPPEQAYAFIDSQGDKFLGKSTADSAKSLLAPLIAEGTSYIDAQILAIPYVGTILGNWNCGCDAAFETTFQVEVMAYAAVADGIAIGKAAKNKDITKVIEILIDKAGSKIACELASEFIGTGSIPVISSVVSKSCSSVLGKGISWLKTAAGDIGEALGIVGYQHIPTDQYYQQNWVPHLDNGAKTASFYGGDALFQFEVPIYNGCFDYFSKSNMSDSTASGECDEEREKFSNQASALQAKMEEDIRKQIGMVYDSKVDQWRASYINLCKVNDPSVPNSNKLTETCNQNIANAFNSGKPVAVQAWKKCQLPANFSYDINKCLKIGNESSLGARNNAIAEIATMNNAYAVKLIVESISKGAAAAKQKAMDDELASWIPQCPYSLKETCVAKLKQVWNVCQANIALIPYNKGGKEFKDQDIKVVAATMASCQKLYSTLTTGYTKHADNKILMMAQESTCDPYKSKSTLFARCKFDLQISMNKCLGGLPYIQVLTSVSQNPAPGDCPKLISEFNDKWHISDLVKKTLNAQTAASIATCYSLELPGCIEAVTDQVNKCRAGIDKQADITVLSLAINSPQLTKAKKDLYAMAAGCGQSIAKIPDTFKKGKGAEVLVMSKYGKLCPAINEKSDYNFQCKNELLKTIAKCKAEGLAQKRSGIAEQEVNACHDQLMAVVEHFNKLENPKFETGKLDKPEAKQGPKIVPNKMAPPPPMGLPKDSIAPAAATPTGFTQQEKSNTY